MSSIVLKKFVKKCFHDRSDESIEDIVQSLMKIGFLSPEVLSSDEFAYRVRDGDVGNVKIFPAHVLLEEASRKFRRTSDSNHTCNVCLEPIKKDKCECYECSRCGHHNRCEQCYYDYLLRYCMRMSIEHKCSGCEKIVSKESIISSRYDGISACTNKCLKIIHNVLDRNLNNY